MHEEAMRTTATGTTEQPRRLQPTPTQPPKAIQPAQNRPKPPPTQQAVEAQQAGFKSPTDQARAKTLGFTDPTQWAAFLAKNPAAQDVPYTVAASPIETDRIAGPPPQPTPAATGQPQPSQAHEPAQAAPPTTQPPPVKARPALPKQAATQPPPTPAKARPPPAQKAATQQATPPTAGDGNTSAQGAAPSQPAATSAAASSGDAKPQPPAKAAPAALHHPAQPAPANPPPKPASQAAPPKAQFPPAHNRDRREPPSYHPHGPPKAVYAQPSGPADPNVPADAMEPADNRLEYEQDRRLRHYLQIPGASIPPAQIPGWPHSQLACQTLEEVVQREHDTTDQPIPYVDQVDYWFITRVPRGERPPKVPVRLPAHRMMGWCAHHCQNRLCRRCCMRPVFNHVDYRHTSHWCDGCYRP